MLLIFNDKDKINIKPAQGAGFKAHQDITAFLANQHGFPTYHISVCIPLKKFTIENGCLEISSDYYGEKIFSHEKGVLCKDIEKTFSFIPILADVGDIILFNSFIVHRAGNNNTNFSR
jgi:ectoine hydroxylase-related dioxygenase (phytanoyl-CoA dioxygenase family)